MLETCLDVVGWRRFSEVDGGMLQSERIALALEAARIVAREHERGRVVGRLDPETFRYWRSRVSLMPRRGAPLTAFVAPELRNGTEATVAGDVYALGCIAFQLIGGRRPPRRFDLLGLRAALRHGWSWTAPLVAALDPRPEKRFADAAAFARALGKLLPTEEEVPEDAAAPATPRRWLNVVSWGLGATMVAASIYGGAAAAATTMTAMVGLAWWLGRGGAFEDSPAPAMPEPQAAPSRLASNSSR